MEQYNMTEGNRSAQSFSRSFPLLNAFNRSKNVVHFPKKGLKAMFVIWLSLCCLMSSTAFGHNLDTLSFDSLNYSLLFEHRLMQTGEQIDFKVQLGTVNAPVYDLAGFDIALEISDQAAFPMDFQLNLDDSWLFASSGADTSVSYQPDEGTASLHGFRSDSTGTFGYGTILQFSLICTEDDVWSDALISELTGGGLMMVDNLEKRQVPDVTSPPIAISAWPNPANGQVQINLEGAPNGEEILLVNSQGQPVLNIQADGPGTLKMDLSTIPAGIYLLQAHLKNGRILQGPRLVVQ